MVKKKITIALSSGLEARPVAMLVQLASQYDSSIYVEKGETVRINAKSIMGMMTLALAEGEDITLIAEGADETDAMNSLEHYLSSK